MATVDTQKGQATSGHAPRPFKITAWSSSGRSVVTMWGPVSKTALVDIDDRESKPWTDAEDKILLAEWSSRQDHAAKTSQTIKNTNRALTRRLGRTTDACGQRVSYLRRKNCPARQGSPAPQTPPGGRGTPD